MSWPINLSHAFYDQTDRHRNSRIIARCFTCLRPNAVQPFQIGSIVANSDTDSDGNADAWAKNCTDVHTHDARAVANAAAENRTTDVSAESDTDTRAKSAVRSIEKNNGRAANDSNLRANNTDTYAG
jgi:hypothetical protein